MLKYFTSKCNDALTIVVLRMLGKKYDVRNLLLFV